MNIEIGCGNYIIRPHPMGSATAIDIMRIDGRDEHGHPFGPVVTIVVDNLFKETP